MRSGFAVLLALWLGAAVYSESALARDLSFLVEQVPLNQHEGPAPSEYPLVLHHGLFGFQKILFLEYFNGIPASLRAQGYQVFVTKVYPLGTIERRARELAVEIDAILRITGKDKVNIIGHSMGGLDARYLISKLGYGDKIASVTMIGTPNRGSYIADLIFSASQSAEGIKRSFLKMLDVESAIAYHNSNKKVGFGGEVAYGGKINVIQEAFTAIQNCSETFLREHFNSFINDDPRVYYQSWSGATSIRRVSSEDLVGPLFLLPYLLLKARDGQNDGLVPENSARWAHYRGSVSADHLDQIGFPLGGVSSTFTHKKFYQQIARELAQKGF